MANDSLSYALESNQNIRKGTLLQTTPGKQNQVLRNFSQGPVMATVSPFS